MSAPRPAMLHSCSPVPKHSHVLLILALLAIVAYLPTLRQPLLEDDYPLIVQAHAFGFGIVADPNFGMRSTSLLLMDGLYRLFGVTAPAFYAATILVHILNTWLVYALGYWRPLGYATTAWAAGFFAVFEAHQEGIMWVSAVNETLLFLFGVGSFLCWLRFLYERRPAWYAASLILLLLALYSKESAVIFFPMMALPLLVDPKPVRQWLWLAPFAVLTAFALAQIRHASAVSFRFNGASFSLHAPFWLIWSVSFARLFWFWGALAVIAILLWRPARYATVLTIGLLWTGLALIPYSFLTYSLRVPSRHTYLASAGVALIVGYALATLTQKRSRFVVAIAAALILLLNVGYLWTKKRTQYLERAAPTEQLIALARTTKGPIFVQCFPRAPLIADAAVQLATGRTDLIWDPAKSDGATKFCYVQK